MESLTLIGTVILVHFLALISPGPDFVMTVKNALSYSRRTGIWTAVGLGIGISVHILYCVAGLAALIAQSIIIFNIIKLMGASYLIYIGLSSVFFKSSHIKIDKTTTKKDISAFSAIKIGFLTNILNPKVTLFFLSLFTLVISPNTPPSILAFVSLAMVLNTMCWFMLVAIFFTQKNVRTVFEKFQGIFNKTFGGLLILIGLKVAVAEK